MDATYRADLRELNELNFSRFDAKMSERITELRADFDKRLTQLDARLDQRLAELGASLRTEFAQGLGQLKGDLLKWMFIFWIPTGVSMIGAAVGVIALLLHR